MAKSVGSNAVAVFPLPSILPSPVRQRKMHLTCSRPYLPTSLRNQLKNRLEFGPNIGRTLSGKFLPELKKEREVCGPLVEGQDPLRCRIGPRFFVSRSSQGAFSNPSTVEVEECQDTENGEAPGSTGAGNGESPKSQGIEDDGDASESTGSSNGGVQEWRASTSGGALGFTGFSNGGAPVLVAATNGGAPELVENTNGEDPDFVAATNGRAPELTAFPGGGASELQGVRSGGARRQADGLNDSDGLEILQAQESMDIDLGSAGSFTGDQTSPNEDSRLQSDERFHAKQADLASERSSTGVAAAHASQAWVLPPSQTEDRLSFVKSHRSLETVEKQLQSAPISNISALHADRLTVEDSALRQQDGQESEFPNPMKTVWKVLAKDMEFIHEGVQVALKQVQSQLPTIVATGARGWSLDKGFGHEASLLQKGGSEAISEGFSSKDIHNADIRALQSFGAYMTELLQSWQTPLSLSYDPSSLASYFLRRPHVLVFRLLEVFAAFSGVALQYGIENVYDRKEKTNGSQPTLRSAKALKLTLLQLGPTFIKVAQSLSSRPDIIGTETAKVLSEMQDRLPPFPTRDAMAVIEEELGVPATRAFSSLSEDPVAAASFGQVYKGLTLEGDEVAVKVQRPDLLFTVARDIYVLRLGLGLLRKVAKMNSDISLLADEVGRGLFGELDYTLEARNAKDFEILHRKLSFVKVPRTFPHLTRKRVLTMEWINGDRPLDLQLTAQGSDMNGRLVTMTQRQEAKLRLDDLVRKGVECSLVQLLDTGLMHADPHPGNLLYTSEGILTYLDFGLVARVEKKYRTAMLAVIAHLVNGEWERLANDLGDLDILKPTIDRFALQLALEQAFGKGPDPVVRDGIPDIRFGQVTRKLWNVALKFRFRLPPFYTLVLRSLASLEGIALSVDPNYKVFSAAYPYVVKRLLNDDSVSSRQVLQSLIMTQERRLRWDRISAIAATSRKSSLDGIVENAEDQLARSSSTESASGKDFASLLLSYTLSNEGSSVRWVLLEADTKSLADALLSASAASFHSKIAWTLSDVFYLSILSFTESEPHKVSLGNPNRRTTESMPDTTEVPASSTVSDAENIPDTANRTNISPMAVNASKIQGIWLLLKILAGRLSSKPILLLRVSWLFAKIVGFAAAVALHRYVVTLSDRYFSQKTKETAGEPKKNSRSNCKFSMERRSLTSFSTPIKQARS